MSRTAKKPATKAKKGATKAPTRAKPPAKKTGGLKVRKKSTVTSQHVPYRRPDGTIMSKPPWGWNPGESGNLEGGPKIVSLSTAYRRVLNTRCPHDPEGRKWVEVIAEGMVLAASNGKVPAAKELRETTEGSAHTFTIDWRKHLADLGMNPDQIVEQLADEMERAMGKKHDV